MFESLFSNDRASLISK